MAQFLRIVIIGNCQLSRIKPMLLKLVPELSVDFIISYENLNPSQEVIQRIQDAELLVVQPVKKYAGLRIEDINSITGGQVPIIRVPFLRFHGFWELTERMLSKFHRDCVMFFPDILGLDDVEPFLTSGHWDSINAAMEHYSSSLLSLKSIEAEQDLSFYSFCEQNLFLTPLFRDPWHPTRKLAAYMDDQMVKSILDHLNVTVCTSCDFNEMPVIRELGHYRPISDMLAQSLGLSYDLESYFMVSRLTYMTKVLRHELNKESCRICTMAELSTLLTSPN